MIYKTSDNNLNWKILGIITGKASKIKVLTADLAAGAISRAADSIFVL